MKTQRVDTWAAPIEDKPGGLADKLNALAAAGVNLEIIIARRAPERVGAGVVFVTPIKGAKPIRAARAAGFSKTASLQTVRVEGPDKAGQVARLAQALGEQGLNLHGLSAAAIGRKFICHVAVDSAADATKAARILQGL